MKGQGDKYLRISKEESEARGRLEVISLLVLNVLNSRATWALIVLAAAGIGIVETDTIEKLLELVQITPTEN